MKTGHIDITLAYDEASNSLQAVLNQSAEKGRLDREFFYEMIRTGGYGDFILDEGAVDNMLNKAVNEETGTFPIGSRKVYSDLTFAFDDDSNILYAVLEPAFVDPELNEDAIKQTLEKSNFHLFFHREDALDTLMARIDKAEQGRFEFSRKLDATVTLDVSEDLMKAYITTTPAYGGAALTFQDVLAAIEEAKIDPGFYNEKMINDLVTATGLDKKLFARGVPARNGTETRFVTLVREVINKEFTEDEHGVIDLHDLNEFVLVEPGTPLMRRIPPTPGESGCDLLGNPIPAASCDEVFFAGEHSGAVLDADDENLLVADIKGHPVIFADGVKVDPVLHLKSVDMNTGDIDFDGSVNIVGDVNAGMAVKASGNVLVTGVVEKATVEAGNDLTVAGGVMGSTLGKEDKEKFEHGSLDPEEFSRSLLKSHLKAGGSISAKFINMADVECGKDLTVMEYILHSMVNAKGRVLLGQAGGKGYLIGGHCHADEGMEVNYLGNENYIKTHVTAGKPNSLIDQQIQLQQELEEIAGQLEKLKLILPKLLNAAKKGQPSEEMKDRLHKVNHTLKALNAQQVDKNKELEKIEAALDEAKIVCVEVTGTAFPNVSITINSLEHVVVNETEGGKYFVEGLSVRHEV